MNPKTKGRKWGMSIWGVAERREAMPLGGDSKTSEEDPRRRFKDKD